MTTHKRQLVRRRERDGLPDADFETKREARPNGDRDCGELGRGDARPTKRLIDRRVDSFAVRLLRERRHHAAPNLMDARLGRKHFAEDGAIAAYDGGARVVAARLDPKHEPAPGIACRPHCER